MRRKPTRVKRILPLQDESLNTPFPKRFSQSPIKKLSRLTDSPNWKRASRGGLFLLKDGTPVVQPIDVDEPIIRNPLAHNRPNTVPTHIKCTVCQKGSPNDPDRIQRHSLLRVPICNRCNSYYTSAKFIRAKDGKHELCSWCGHGGDLLCCDFCPSTFCKKCISSNLGRPYCTYLFDSPNSWKCFLCAPRPLTGLSTLADMITEPLVQVITDSGEDNLPNLTQKNLPDALRMSLEWLESFSLELRNLQSKLCMAEENDRTLLDNFRAVYQFHTDMRLNKLNSVLAADPGSEVLDGKGANDSAQDSDNDRVSDDVEYLVSLIDRPLPTSVPGSSSRPFFPRLIDRTVVDMDRTISHATSHHSFVQSGAEPVLAPPASSCHSGNRVSILSEEQNPMDKVDAYLRRLDCRDFATRGYCSDAEMTADSPADDDRQDGRRSSVRTKTSNGPSKATRSNASSNNSRSTSRSSSHLALDENVSLNVSRKSLTLRSDQSGLSQAIDSASRSSQDEPRRLTRSRKPASPNSRSTAASSKSSLDFNEAVSISSSDSFAVNLNGPRTRMTTKRMIEDSSSSEKSSVGQSTRNSSNKRSKTRKAVVDTDEEDENSDEVEILDKTIAQARRSKRLSKGSSASSKTAKKSGSDSDSADTKAEEDSTRKARVTRRGKLAKRKVQTQDSSDEEDKEGDDKKGRRHIRHIIQDNKLSTDTKSAELEERERKRRMEERQKQYNQFAIENGEDSKARATRVILERDPDDESKALVELHPDLVHPLKPHQIEAIRFLYDCVIESAKLKAERASSGAILAHCMGLGKTLASIAFIHVCLTHPLIKLHTCLVLCPVNTVLNWYHEFDMWVPQDEPLDVFELISNISVKDRQAVIANWQRRGGVLLMGYDMFRNLLTTGMKRIRSKEAREQLEANLCDPGPDLVICDEGHLLKNEKSGLNRAVSRIGTRRRVILTGTPLQNNLCEYWTMVNFVKPSLLGTSKEFANRFINPIKNGQHSNSTSSDVKLMKKRAHILYKTLDGCVQRKDYNALTKYLPPRHEYVLKLRLTEEQKKFYRRFLEVRPGPDEADENRRCMLFNDQQQLYRVWTHPFCLKIHASRESRKSMMCSTTEEEEDEEDDDEEEEEATASSDEVVSSSLQTGTVTLSSSSSSSVESVPSATAATSSSRKRPRKQRLGSTSGDSVIVVDEVNSTGKQRRTRAEGEPDTEPLKSKKRQAAVPWWDDLYQKEYDGRVDVGVKLDVLFRLLKRCSDIGDKVLVFSHSLFSLDLIEKYLCELDVFWRKTEGEDPLRHSEKWPAILSHMQLRESVGESEIDLSEYLSDSGPNSWVSGLDYERMDGSVNPTRRKNLQSRFNRTSNKRLRLFLISTRAGGLGINLVGANRLVLFDVSWNPSHDVQSIFRSYRFGQTKPVYIYRFIAQGTMEEKIYDRQVTKQSLSLRVIDEQQIDRHFTESDLQALYSFEPDEWDEATRDKRKTPILPKDRLLADLLNEHPNLIVGYHTHDSLLENREDEGLTEAERREAWKEFEEEKTLGVTLIQHQRMMAQSQNAALLMQQQQQQQQRNQQQFLAQQQFLRMARPNMDMVRMFEQQLMQQMRPDAANLQAQQQMYQRLPFAMNGQGSAMYPPIPRPAPRPRFTRAPLQPLAHLTAPASQPGSAMQSRFTSIMNQMRQSNPDIPQQKLENLALSALVNGQQMSIGPLLQAQRDALRTRTAAAQSATPRPSNGEPDVANS